ncbi:Hemerythrin HHE cation binding domain-containing protein [Streptomyces sp. cf386]|uniref:hemerythrin domain-containing protein n=1 Tax=Streptomyces sp. cf386 TaxID=1761904 RepID=UPI0008838FE0|nr:hemerythrin domain-containing protein [Streptomyces sp. cf386]SDP01311.1 Hemerythrin HHE cation binding domain-containing protein [Streptomyces sp. cf386]
MAVVKNDMTGFMLTHDLIRQTVPELAERLAAADAGDTGALQRLGQWWGLFTTILNRHHEVEDRLVWPVAIAAAPGLADAVEEIESQHAELDGHLERIDTGLNDLAAIPAADWPARVRDLCETVTVFAAVLEEHLLLEERTLVPALETTVTAEAFAELGAALARDHSPESVATELPMVVGSADDAQRQVMLGRLPEPVRQRFLTEWEPRYRSLVASLPAQAPVTAV